MRVHGSASLPSTGLEWRCLIQQVLTSYAAQHQGLAPLFRFMQNEPLGHVCIYLSNPPSFSCHHFSLTTISTFLCMHYCPILLSLIYLFQIRIDLIVRNCTLPLRVSSRSLLSDVAGLSQPRLKHPRLRMFLSTFPRCHFIRRVT